jgi:hypothetical protein
MIDIPAAVLFFGFPLGAVLLGWAAVKLLERSEPPVVERSNRLNASDLPDLIRRVYEVLSSIPEPNKPEQAQSRPETKVE